VTLVSQSFKTNADLYQVTNIPFWFNQRPTLEHFRYLFDQTLFGRWLLNSLIIGVCVVAITLATAIPAGYALTRLAGRNAEALGIGIFLTYLGTHSSSLTQPLLIRVFLCCHTLIE
jgi:multiple sugar transport system permease protein